MINVFEYAKSTALNFAEISKDPQGVSNINHLKTHITEME